MTYFRGYKISWIIDDLLKENFLGINFEDESDRHCSYYRVKKLEDKYFQSFVFICKILENFNLSLKINHSIYTVCMSGQK